MGCALYDDPKPRDDPEFWAEMADLWKEDFIRYQSQGMKPKDVPDRDQRKSYRIWLRNQKILQDAKIPPPPGGSTVQGIGEKDTSPAKTTIVEKLPEPPMSGWRW